MDKNYIWVTRHKGDGKRGTVRFDNIFDVKWDSISGGYIVPSGMWGLYGYVMCNCIVEGEIGHSGIHGPCPHRIKVFIPKSYNKKELYLELEERAGKKPTDGKRKNVADAVRQVVEDNPGILATEVYEILQEKGIARKTVMNTITYLRKRECKNKKSIIVEPYKTTRKLYIK